MFVFMYLLFLWILESPPPQVMSTAGGTEVIISVDRSGHYQGEGAINGVPVDFLVDSGATYVAIPSSMASRLGVDLKKAAEISVETAAGRVKAYRVIVDSVRFTAIEQKNVAAVVIPNLDSPLLGMNFLRKISISQKDGKMSFRVDKR
mgnify:FL=1